VIFVNVPLLEATVPRRLKPPRPGVDGTAEAVPFHDAALQRL